MPLSGPLFSEKERGPWFAKDGVKGHSVAFRNDSIMEQFHSITKEFQRKELAASRDTVHNHAQTLMGLRVALRREGPPDIGPIAAQSMNGGRGTVHPPRRSSLARPAVHVG